MQPVELPQPVAGFEADHAHDERAQARDAETAAEEPRRGPVHVRLQEGDEVGARLADDVVVDVEEPGNALERRVAVRVRRQRPVPEVGRVRGRPGPDVAVRVLAEDPGLPAAV